MEHISQKIKLKAQKIKVIVTDVDGVLTDGAVFIAADGTEPFARFNIHDGLGTIHAREFGIDTVVLSGRKSLCVEARCRDLGVKNAYTGVKDKHAKILEIVKEMQVEFDEVAYLGDDVIDLRAMSLVGLKIAPQNALLCVKERVDYITRLSGGEGVLREVINLILQCQNKHDAYLQKFI